MTSFLTNCAKTIGDKFIDLIINETHYLCCYKCIVEDFEKEKEELKSKLKRIEGDVQEASNRNEIILEDVDFHLKKGHNLIEENTEKKRTWFFGWCPNCIWLYSRGKELAGKVEELKILKDKNFDKVGRSCQLPGVVSQDFIEFKSRDLAYQKLLEAFKDDNNYVVGLYGMGGTGKTTLAKKVGKTVKESNLFDEVVFTVVSNDYDIRKIQINIATHLGLKIKQQNEQDIQAKELMLRLTNGQKILIILDDVWQELNFESIGIPFKGNQNGCRILLTSRESRNLKSCQQTIKLELLSNDDARFLFNEHASVMDDFPINVKKLVPQIADECKRLPVAIVAIARSLKNQPIEVWRATLKSLKELKKIENIDEELMIYKSFELSYKNLREEKAKKLFLLCSLFPEDYEIHEEELTRYGIGLGLFGDIDSYEAARIDVVYAKRKLLDACLLLEGENEKCVKMHDWVRDSAHWIANYEIQVIMRPKMNGPRKNVTMRYLFCNKVNGFLDQLNCCKLEILILKGEKIPTEAFFEGLKHLKVLRLDNTNPLLQPSIDLQLSSSELAKNLRTLCLQGFTLGDISFVESLQGLETFELKSCSIDELPNGIVILKKLKLLSLQYCEIQRNPYQVISKPSQLEELYFLGNRGWEEKLDNKVVASLFDKSLSLYQLKRYDIEIGQNINLYRSVDGSTSRAIAIKHFDASISNATIQDLVQRAQILHLREMQGNCKTIIPDFVTAIQDGLDELIELELNSCSTIKCLINATNPLSSEFSSLVKLKLASMDHLKKICYKPPPVGLFEKLEEIDVSGCSQLDGTLFVGKWNLERLKELNVRDCPMLTTLFTTSTVRSLVLLEELRVTACEGLKYVLESEEEEEQVGEIVGNNSVHQSYDSMFPNLKTMSIMSCKKLELICKFCCKSGREMVIGSKVTEVDSTASIMGLHFVFPKLERLVLKDCSELKCFAGQCHCEDQNHNTEIDIDLSALKSFYLMRCPQFTIKSISNFMIDINARQLDWTNKKDLPEIERHFTLKILYVEGSRVDDIFCVKGVPTIGQQFMTSELKLQSRGPKHIIYFQNLERLRIKGCEELQTMFSSSVLRNLPRLTCLCIKDCENLEQIIEEENVSNSVIPQTKPYFPRLQDLTIQRCNKLKALFSISTSYEFPELKILIIHKASQLQKVFDTESHLKVEFPKLKFLVLVQLESLADICQGIQLQNVTYRFVHNCPKCSFDSTTINVDDLLEKHFDVGGLPRPETYTALNDIINEIKAENAKPEITSMDHEDQNSRPSTQSESEATSSQINEEVETEAVTEVPPAEIQPKATSSTLSIAVPSQNSNPQGIDGNVLQVSIPERATPLSSSTLSDPQSSTSLSLKTYPHDTSAQPQLLVKGDIVNEVDQIIKERSAAIEDKRINDIKQLSEPGNFPSGSPVISVEKASPQSVKLEAQSETGGGKVFEIATMETSSTELVSAKRPLHKTLSHGETWLSTTETDFDKESKTNHINLQDFQEDDLIRLIKIMEEDADIQVAKPSISVSASELANLKDSLVSKAFSDLEATLKMPLNEIANSEENSLRLKNALGVLSNHCIEDAEKSIGFKTTIDSMHQEFQSIVSSFKQASATIDKFTELEQKEKSIKEGLPQQKDAAITLISDICKTEKSMTEALSKEADLKEQISRLQAEIKDCEIKLSSLQQQKKKRVEDTIELVKEFESVKKDKSQTVEDQIKARQELDKVNDNWSSCAHNLRKTALLLGIHLKQRI